MQYIPAGVIESDGQLWPRDSVGSLQQAGTHATRLVLAGDHVQAQSARPLRERLSHPLEDQPGRALGIQPRDGFCGKSKPGDPGAQPDELPGGGPSHGAKRLLSELGARAEPDREQQRTPHPTPGCEQGGFSWLSSQIPTFEAIRQNSAEPPVGTGGRSAQRTIAGKEGHHQDLDAHTVQARGLDLERECHTQREFS
jgi:hypothetical protein